MKPVIALDIETTGTDPWRDEIYMCGIWDGVGYWCIRRAADLENILAQYPDHDIVGHNTDFDIKFLLVKGWLKEYPKCSIHDTKVIGSLLRNRIPKEFLEQYEIKRKELNKTLPKGVSHRQGSPLSLKTMAPWYLKVPPFWETPGDHNNEEYNRLDCKYTYELFQMLAPRLQDEGSWAFYTERMLEWKRMILEMEMSGIDISMDELAQVEQEYSLKRALLKAELDVKWAEAHKTYRKKQEQEIKDKYTQMALTQIEKGRDFKTTMSRYDAMAERAVEKLEVKINYSSPTQMAWLLKEHLGLDIEDMDGEESTGKAVLNKLASEGRDDIKTFLDWREADKVLTMYVPTYKELQVNGTIHPSFNLTGTRTGRTSSSGPNLQQVPSKLYRLFRPRPGYKFIQYDLSGIEAALIALYSGDQTLYEILDKGESIHDHNAKAMFDLGCDVSEVSTLFPRERKTVKNIGFACFYGAGWRRISKVFAAGGFPISDSESKRKLDLLRSYYPGAFSFHKEITEVFESGETVYNLLGRPLTLQPHENPYMQGFNTLIQSSASDINLRACEKFWKQGQARPLLVIHDCIIAEAKTDVADQVAEQLVKCMTDFKLESANGLIKLRVEGGVSERWEK